MARHKSADKRKRVRSSAKAGVSPGTMVFIGEQKQSTTRLDVIDYTPTSLDEVHDASLEACRQLAESQSVTWINVTAVHDVALIEGLGKAFGLHPLTLEDIVNTTQRLKTEEFANYLYTVIKMISVDPASGRIRIEHVSLILGDNYVLSFLEDEGDLFDAVRARIRTSKGRIRTMRADYLAYALIDTVVDQYFHAVERIGDQVEEIDERILVDVKPADMHDIHRLKRDVLGLRKAAWPLRDEIGTLARGESALLRAETSLYWRDLYDHTIQIIDMVENYRDLLGSLHDTYLSTISNRMNEVMKMLTIIATLFIPLTFIVGVYGMNFAYMPELQWRWGYFAVWGVMLIIAVGLLALFRKKKWL